MRDQASALRNLIQRPTAFEATSLPSERQRARVIVFASGKGGVGKSNLALNVAVAMSQSGSRVCVLDANPGLSNIDLLCGLNCYWNLSHVVTGAKSLHEVILKGPAEINVIPGASELVQLADASASGQHEICSQLESLEMAYDVLVVDLGSGLHEVSRRFVAVSDVAFIITTPEPTAIAGAYATLKTWHDDLPPATEVVVNRANSAAQAGQILDRIAQTSELFLRQEVPTGSSVAEDPSVAKAVFARQPFLCLLPDSPASRDVRQIAKRALTGATKPRKESLLARMRVTH